MAMDSQQPSTVKSQKTTGAVRPLMLLVGVYYFLQGMGGNPGLHDQSLRKYLKEGLHFGPADSAEFVALLWIPWMIKPLYGVITDFLPIFGSRRRSYFILSGVLSAAAYAWLAHSVLTAGMIKVTLVITAIGFAFADVLCDAVMVEKGQPLGATDRLQAAQWTGIGIAGVVVAFSKGYIAEFCSLPTALLLSAVFPVITVVLTLAALRERPVSSTRDGARRAWEGVKSAARMKPLWAAACFIFLFQCSPSLGSVLYYYEKDILGFSDVLIGQIDAVGNVAFLIGTFLYGLVASKIRYELLLKAIIVSGVVSTLLYLFFNTAMTAFAVTALASVVSVVAFLGILTVAAQVCPAGAEGTVFALLMAVSNAGTQAGQVLGGHLYTRISYGWLVVISAVATAAMWLLLPLVRPKTQESMGQLQPQA